MFAGIGLVNPKNKVNIGAVLRAANCYGANFVVTSGQRYAKAITDTAYAVRDIPLFQCQKPADLRSFIPFDCVPVAVDLIPDAIPLPEYTHPRRAFYIFGPEDGTLGKLITKWCRDVVYIPTQQCMNLAATVNVILYDRLVKLERSNA